jgi:hypothetical protein
MSGSRVFAEVGSKSDADCERITDDSYRAGPSVRVALLASSQAFEHASMMAISIQVRGDLPGSGKRSARLRVRGSDQR